MVLSYNLYVTQAPFWAQGRVHFTDMETFEAKKQNKKKNQQNNQYQQQIKKKESDGPII